jgi:retinol dehydrogenase 12
MLFENALDHLISSTAIYVACTIIFLILAKRYFAGGVCRVNRDLTGQVILVTGGNSGLGKEVIRQLVKQPVTVIFGARDNRKSEQAKV